MAKQTLRHDECARYVVAEYAVASTLKIIIDVRVPLTSVVLCPKNKNSQQNITELLNSGEAIM